MARKRDPKKKRNPGVRGQPGLRAPTKARPYYWAIVDSVRHNFGKVESEAKTAFKAVMAARGTPTREGPTAAQLVEAFLDWCERELPKSYRWYSDRLAYWVRWLDAAGHAGLPASEVKPHHIEDWLGWCKRLWAIADAKPARERKRRGKGGDTERHNLIRAVQRVHNWAAKGERIERSRIASVPKPRVRIRDFVYSAEQFRAIFAATDDAFRDVLTILAEQGCRPEEVRLVEVRHVDLQAGVWRFPMEEYKTGRKTGKPRIVYLTPAALELTRRLVAERGEGHLFLNAKGRRWLSNAICLRFRRLRERLGLPAGAVAYGLRHTFVTLARERGLDAATVALLLGHSDAQMVTRVYSHMEQRPEWLREQAAKAAGLRSDLEVPAGDLGRDGDADGLDGDGLGAGDRPRGRR